MVDANTASARHDHLSAESGAPFLCPPVRWFMG
jgi:hypothetical protein